MSKKYHLFGKVELESAIVRLRDELKDLEETINYNFSNTCAHIMSGEVLQDEEILEGLRAEVREVELLLVHAE